MPAAIRTRELRKVYTAPPPLTAGGGFGARRRNKQPAHEIVALDGLSLDVQAGEIFGLLGPNGAGKSTTVGILTTRVRPTNGQAWIGDYDVWGEQAEVKRLIGVLFLESGRVPVQAVRILHRELADADQAGARAR